MQDTSVRLNVLFYRLTGGIRMSQKILLLTTRGRKSGQPRTTPVMYTRDGNAYVVVAVNSGLDRMPAWYLNLSADPNVEIQVGRQRMKARAEAVPPEERQALWEARVAMQPRAAENQAKTRRTFPIFRLIPQ